MASPVAPLPHRGRARPRPYYSPRPGWGASTDPVLLRVCAATLPASTRWWNSWRGSNRAPGGTRFGLGACVFIAEIAVACD